MNIQLPDTAAAAVAAPALPSSTVLHKPLRTALLALACAMAPAAQAAEFDGGQLGLLWAVPFAGILLCIALCPLFTPGFWHHHFGKVSIGWALAFLVPFSLVYGPEATVHQAAHALLAEYLPFIIVLFALYTVAGGLCLRGNLHGSPGMNTLLLAIGTFLASWAGTTGAAMLMIRPVIRANDGRRHNVHVIVFFIFLVANAGGSLTPLGDPPLFLGFLKGVDFFWTTGHLLAPTALLCAVLLAVFFLLDVYFYRREDDIKPAVSDPTPDSRLRLEGKVNLLFLAAIVGAVLLSGFWKPDLGATVLGVELELQNVVRDVLLVTIALISLALTPRSAREGNGFNWGPILEVAKLFIGIFLTIIPVIAILRAGQDGAMGGIVRMVTDGQGQPVNAMYFWLTGILSSFLDNAPTYLVFFNLAGGEPATLMGPLAATLAAISAGAVYMGAMSYIGNAPNFMVKAIAEDRGIRMPSFFGYMAWSVAILIPCFLLLTVVFFR
jgi:Na+/H+ antiporter NhaD/arsenite permease-like protein